MPIQYTEGDLFLNSHEAEAFAHGCNCKGAMGSGIAAQFKVRYPAMFETYKGMCFAKPRQFNPGNAWLWQEDSEQPHVFNLATQDGYIGVRPAKIQWVRLSLEAMRREADAAGITKIAMPAIASGLGGLAWKDVKDVVETVFGDWPGTLIVYERYVKGR